MLAGATVFVVLGGVLIVAGAARRRWNMILIGALGCLFFGMCAWVALAVLRRSL